MLKGKVLPYANGLLRTKRREWHFEDEYRLYLTTEGEKYLSGTAPTAVILGVRTGQYDSAFSAICRKFGMRIGYLNARRELATSCSSLIPFDGRCGEPLEDWPAIAVQWPNFVSARSQERIGDAR